MAIRATEHRLADLVDRLVEAVDLNRQPEIERLRQTLDDLGAAELFDAELRLNGTPSQPDGCICQEVH